jgi:predicted nuclease with TOPRIM domain
MNNDQINTGLTTLERKLKLLLNEYNALREETAALRAENQQLKESVKNREDQVKDFQNKYKITKIAGNLRTGEADISDIKSLLNEYIGEIDKCIVHLSQG